MREKLVGNLEKGNLFVLSAPAGTGKTTLVRMLTEEFDSVVESISYTTRLPRPQEVEGKDYYFLTESAFKKKIAAQEFLEHVELFGHFYGTCKRDIFVEQEKGHHVFLVIDTQGALQLQGKIEATFIFVAPPSLDDLGERLYKRSTESEQQLQNRLQVAKEEMEMISHYDYCIVNDKLDIAYQVLRSIVIAEERKIIHKGKIW